MVFFFSYYKIIQTDIAPNISTQPDENRIDMSNRLKKGIKKLKIRLPNLTKIDKHWEVLTEPLQTILRKHSVEKKLPYFEKIKTVSQGMKVDAESYHRWIKSFDLPHEEVQILSLTPLNYIGAAADFDLTSLSKKLDK